MARKIEREMARFAELTLKNFITLDNIFELEDMSIVTSIYENNGLVYIKSIDNDEEIIIPFKADKDYEEEEIDDEISEV